MNEIRIGRMIFYPHKIRSIDIDTCNCEQKIAYNYLFSYSDIAKHKALDIIQKSLATEINRKKYDIDLIYHYILSSYDRFMQYNKSHILTSYLEIGSVIYWDQNKRKKGIITMIRYHVFNEFQDFYFFDYKAAEKTARLNACKIIDMDSGEIIADFRDDIGDW